MTVIPSGTPRGISGYRHRSTSRDSSRSTTRNDGFWNKADSLSHSLRYFKGSLTLRSVQNSTSFGVLQDDEGLGRSKSHRWRREFTPPSCSNSAGRRESPSHPPSQTSPRTPAAGRV